MAARLFPFLLIGIAIIVWKIYQNAQIDSQVTHLDGWQQTAEKMMPIPPSHVQLHDAVQRKTQAS